MDQQDKISILGPRDDGTYVVEFRTAEGKKLTITVPRIAELYAADTEKYAKEIREAGISARIRGRASFREPHVLSRRSWNLLKRAPLVKKKRSASWTGIESKATGSNSRAEPRRSGTGSPTMTSM